MKGPCLISYEHCESAGAPLPPRNASPAFFVFCSHSCCRGEVPRVVYNQGFREEGAYRFALLLPPLLGLLGLLPPLPLPGLLLLLLPTRLLPLIVVLELLASSLVR